MRIVCIGDNVIDEYQNQGVMYPGGNAVNVAAHAALLHQQAYYVGRIGEDPMSDVILSALYQVHVDTSYVKRIPDAATKYCRYDVIDGERTFLSVVVPSNWAGTVMAEDVPPLLYTCDIVHCSVNAKIPELVATWQNLSGCLVYDFGEKEKYRTPEYLKPIGPMVDLGMFSCPEMELAQAQVLTKTMHGYGIQNVLLTMGVYGQYMSNGTELLFHKGEVVPAVDTMGAGDAFLAACVLSLYESGWKKGQLLETMAMEQALAAGSAYAGSNCMKKGGFGIEVSLRQ